VFPVAKKQNHSTYEIEKKKKRRKILKRVPKVRKDINLSITIAERTALKGAELLS